MDTIIAFKIKRNDNTRIYITRIGILSFPIYDLNVYLTNKLLEYLSFIIISYTTRISINTPIWKIK